MATGAQPLLAATRRGFPGTARAIRRCEAAGRLALALACLAQLAQAASALPGTAPGCSDLAVSPGGTNSLC